MTNLVKISFNAIPKTYQALTETAGIESLSRTDILNRAVQVYALLVTLQQQGDEILIRKPNGTLELLRIL